MALAKDPTQSIQSCSLYANFSGSSSSSSSSSSPIKVPDLSNCSGLLYAVHHEVADHTSETTHNNNGYVFQPDHFKAAAKIGHGHDQDMFMHTSAGSLLSFVQNEGGGGVILQDSYSKTSSDDQEDEFSVWENNLNNNFVSKCSTNNGNMRLLENFNCFQTASNSNNHQNGEDMFGGLFYTEAEGATATNDGIIQEISTTHNKRHNMGESMQALKKQCTGVGATRKPKPKAVSISKDPQSIAAKNRRERISERLKTLQELVPNGSKVDLVTMLEKAISYVKFLQLQVKVLATDEFWPAQGGKAPEISQVKEAIDAILLSSQREHKN